MSARKLTKYGVPFPAREQMVPVRPLPPLPKSWTNLSSAFVFQARSTPQAEFAVDSVGTRITYADALLRACVLAHAIKGRLHGQGMVGVLVPPSVPSAIANIACTLLGKTTVNMNYTLSAQELRSYIDQCQIKVVVTSRKLCEKQGLTLDCDVIYMEDLKDGVGAFDKAWGFMVAKLVPFFALRAFLPGMGCRADDLATIMFTTGSTGNPKGVMLTHKNILSNIWQINSHGRLEQDDRVMGILPFFHSFGFTVTLWAIAVLGRSAVYHTSPLEGRIVGKLLGEHKATLMACTPTLMANTYLLRCTAEQFKTVRWLLLGSEKLMPELAAEIEKKFGVEPVEGFGCTELSPVAAANVPQEVTTPDGRRVHGNKIGSVGQPVPGTAVAIVDVETGEITPPGSGREGLIFIAGPQVMKGYLNRPKETNEVLNDGIYCTGDVGVVDADGFLFIIDRLDEFAKIVGEMVPVIKVTKALRKVCGAADMELVVRAIPHPTRGEQLIVLYTKLDITPQEAVSRLKEEGLPNLWLPKADAFYQVPAPFPTAATGKLNLKELKRMAIELAKGNA